MKRLGVTRTLRRLGFRQTIKGALIIGFLTGLMMGAQGAAFAEAYPDQHARDLFMASLESAPALGFLSGEVKDVSTPASYSIYKSIALMTLITGVWGLLTTTRLLRGQEEDGRLEALVAGRTTKHRASLQLLVGYGYSVLIAYLIAFALIAALGAAPKVGLSVGGAALLTLGVFLPGIFFASLGTLTSQLAVSRGRAIAYALVPLLVLFALRGAANSVADWNWLKQFSPFGWTDLLDPVLAPQTGWIIPTVVGLLLFVPLGLYFAARRDLGSSVLPQSDKARSHFYLLGSAGALSVRQNIWTFIWWGLGTVAYASMLASVAKIAAEALSEAPAFKQVIGHLGGTFDDLVIAFLGFGGLFTALILLVMSAVMMGAIRRDEAKGYVDNLLVQPLRRSNWFVGRLLLIVTMVTLISLLTGYAIWQIATLQGVTVDPWIISQNAIALVGTVVLTLGVGAALYGLAPRIATAAMYALIIWAFIVDVLKSFFSLGDFIDKTSLLHYVSFAPNVAPNWSTFLWLITIGFVLMGVGTVALTRRDVVAE